MVNGESMNRFERRKNETHESILEAATALIAESGLGGFSLEAVADRADVSRATLYNHYADKGGLLREVLEAALRVEQSADNRHHIASAMRVALEFWGDAPLSTIGRDEFVKPDIAAPGVNV